MEVFAPIRTTLSRNKTPTLLASVQNTEKVELPVSSCILRARRLSPRIGHQPSNHLFVNRNKHRTQRVQFLEQKATHPIDRSARAARTGILRIAQPGQESFARAPNVCEAGRAERRRTARKRLSKLILDSYLSKGRRAVSFEGCRNQEFRALFLTQCDQGVRQPERYDRK
jgi:hypothetical protein